MSYENEMTTEYKDIYKKYYNEEISDGMARELLQSLINVYKIVYRQPPQAVSLLNEVENELNNDKENLIRKEENMG